MATKLNNLILKSAKKALQIQNKDGSFPKGNNGPWRDTDTFIRTTAHWALLLYRAFEISKDKIFYSSAKKACDFLIKSEQRPYGYSFYCRDSKNKDKCNGLIGQAWALEPLILIGLKSNNSQYLETAKDVILKHQYSFNSHLWRTLEITGEDLGVHSTINQQIWFSAMVLILGTKLKDRTLVEKSEDFFKFLYLNIEYSEEEGLINHWRKKNKSFSKSILKKIISIIFKKRNTEIENPQREMAIGYLSFILQGFALSYYYCPNCSFWQNKRLQKIISKAYQFIEQNFPYGFMESHDSFRWSYNPVGIEMAFSTQTLNKYIGIDEPNKKISNWLSMQFSGYFDDEKELMIKNTIDPNILASRLYELINLHDCDLDIN